MSLDNKPFYTGGCQCGSVRFRVEGALGEASVCHCRMCQKASGNFYLPLVSVRDARLEWTRAQPKRFQSSSHAFRGFCDHCGTPLTFEAPDGIALAIATFDDPTAIAPTIQWGIEAKLAFVDHVHELPGETTEQDIASAPYLAHLISFQHPDHETDRWPVAERP